MANLDASPQDATPLTRAANRAVLDALPFADARDFEDARRGFIATLPEARRRRDGPARAVPVRRHPGQGPRGQVDAGLGKVTSRGTVTLIPPTRLIEARASSARASGRPPRARR